MLFLLTLQLIFTSQIKHLQKRKLRIMFDKNVTQQQLNLKKINGVSFLIIKTLKQNSLKLEHLLLNIMELLDFSIKV